MLYSDFVNLTSATAADTPSTSGTITYNGVGGRVLGFWASGGDQTATAAEARKPYFQVTGDGMPGVTPNLPLARWRSAYLAGASVGSVSGDATFLPLDAPAPASGVITLTVKNAASTAAELYSVGVLYGTDSLPVWAGLSGDPWVLRGVPKTYMTATPTSITTTTETNVGSITVPASNPHVVGVTTAGATNGVRVTAEEFFSTARYTATGVKGQFEPSQKWPVFGQQDAPVGTDIQDESFVPGSFHPLDMTVAANSTLSSLVTLRTGITNASSFQEFVALI